MFTCLALGHLLSYSCSLLKFNSLHIFIILYIPLNDHVNSTYFFKIQINCYFFHETFSDPLNQGKKNLHIFKVCHILSCVYIFTRTRNLSFQSVNSLGRDPLSICSFIHQIFILTLWQPWRCKEFLLWEDGILRLPQGQEQRVLSQWTWCLKWDGKSLEE